MLLGGTSSRESTYTIPVWEKLQNFPKKLKTSLSCSQEKFYLPDGVLKEKIKKTVHIWLWRKKMANTSLLQFNANKFITYLPPISLIMSTAQLHKHQTATAVTTQDSEVIHAPRYYSLFLFCPMCPAAGCTHQPWSLIWQLLSFINFSNVTSPCWVWRGHLNTGQVLKLLNNSSSARPFCTYHFCTCIRDTSMHWKSPLKSLSRFLQRITSQLIL